MWCQATSASLQHGEVLALWRGGGWKGLEHRPLDDGGERWLFLWPGSQWQQRRGAQKSKAAAMTESRSSKKCTRRQEVHDQMVKSTFFFFVGHPKIRISMSRVVDPLVKLVHGCQAHCWRKSLRCDDCCRAIPLSFASWDLRPKHHRSRVRAGRL